MNSSSSSSSQSSEESEMQHTGILMLSLPDSNNNYSSNDDVYHTPPQDSLLPTAEERNPNSLDITTVSPKDSVLPSTEKQNPDTLNDDTSPAQGSVLPTSQKENPDGLNDDAVPPQDSVLPSSEEQNTDGLDDDTVPPEDSVFPSSEEQNPSGNTKVLGDSVLPSTEKQNTDGIDGDTMRVDSEVNTVDLSRDSWFWSQVGEHSVIRSSGIDLNVENVGGVGSGSRRSVDEFFDSQLKRVGGFKRGGSEIEGSDEKMGEVLENGLDVGSGSGKVEVGGSGGIVGIGKGLVSQLKVFAGLIREGSEIQEFGNKRAKIVEKGLGPGSGSKNVDLHVCQDEDQEFLETGGNLKSSGVQYDGLEGKLDKVNNSEIQGFDEEKDKIAEKDFKLGLGNVSSCIGCDAVKGVMENGSNVQSFGVRGDSDGDEQIKGSVQDVVKFMPVGRPVTSSSSLGMDLNGEHGIELRLQPRSISASVEEDVAAPVCADDTQGHHQEDQEITLLDVLKMVAKKREAARVSTGEKMSIFETAESVGLTFPQPRWWPKEGFPEDDEAESILDLKKAMDFPNL